MREIGSVLLGPAPSSNRAKAADGTFAQSSPDGAKSEIAAARAVAELGDIQSPDVERLDAKFAKFEKSARRHVRAAAVLTSLVLLAWTWLATRIGSVAWHDILSRLGVNIATPNGAGIAGIAATGAAVILVVLILNALVVRAAFKDASNDSVNLKDAIGACRDALKTALEDSSASRPPAVAALCVRSALRTFERIRVDAHFERSRQTTADAFVIVVVLASLAWGGRSLLASAAGGSMQVVAIVAWLIVGTFVLWRYLRSRVRSRIEISGIENAEKILFDTIATRLYYLRENAHFLPPGTRSTVEVSATPKSAAAVAS